MSVTASKLQRYGVTFKNRLIYVNATSGDEALAKTRDRLIGEQSSKPDTTPDEDLVAVDRFSAVARFKVSLRY